MSVAVIVTLLCLAQYWHIGCTYVSLFFCSSVTHYHRQRLKTTQIYYLMVSQVRGPDLDKVGSLIEAEIKLLAGVHYFLELEILFSSLCGY